MSSPTKLAIKLATKEFGHLNRLGHFFHQTSQCFIAIAGKRKPVHGHGHGSIIHPSGPLGDLPAAHYAIDRMLVTIKTGTPQAFYCVRKRGNQILATGFKQHAQCSGTLYSQCLSGTPCRPVVEKRNILRISQRPLNDLRLSFAKVQSAQSGGWRIQNRMLQPWQMAHSKATRILGFPSHHFIHHRFWDNDMLKKRLQDIQ
jgi:hypothetical protein